MSVYGDGPVAVPLDDVIAAVKGVFSDLGALRTDPMDGGIEWLEGERYQRSEGAPPRIFVLRSEENDLGGPSRMGTKHCAGVGERCTFFCWGAETTADGTRYAASRALAVRVLNALKFTTPGRVKLLAFRKPISNKIITYGEEYIVAIRYSWDVPKDGEIWNLPVTPNDAIDPMRPHGDTGKIFDLNLGVEVDRTGG